MDTTILAADELCKDMSDTREVLHLICVFSIPGSKFNNFYLKMALTQWNTTDNVITWFNRLALSKGDFKIQTGAGNYNFEVNKLYRSLSHHYLTYSTFIPHFKTSFKELNTCAEAFKHNDSMPFIEAKFGIHKQLATKICELAFKNDIVKLTIEIANPRVLEVVKDIRVTFSDMLGTIGKQSKGLLYSRDCQLTVFQGEQLGYSQASASSVSLNWPSGSTRQSNNASF